LPLLLLNGTLVLRIAADLLEAGDVRRWSGMLQAITIVLFLVISAGSAIAGNMRHTQAGGRRPKVVT
jgi:hypothetical protein